MKSITISCLNYLREIYDHLDEVKRWLIFGLLIPLSLVFFLMEWDMRVLVFILLGYAAALVGFMFARTPAGKGLLTEEEERYHSLIVGATEEVVFIHNLENGRNVFVTPSVKEVLGFQPHHIVNRYCTFLVHPDDRKKMMKLLQADIIRRKSGMGTRMRIMEKGGEYRWMSFNVRPVEEKKNQFKYVVCTLRDVQQQQEMEKVSRLYMQELMRKDPNVVLDDEVSSQMLGLMTAHEMKEPLRTIHSYVQLLQMRHQSQLQEEGQEFLHFVGDAVERLNNMIEDMEALFKMDRHQTKLKKVNTQKLAEGTLRLLERKIKNKNANVIVGMLPEVMADASQLRHVFQNLIDNALKYADDQPNIRISCKAQANYWVFEVRDNGIGVPVKYKEAIFDAFRRLHGPQEYGGGSGIGLSICRKVIENHSGSIWVNTQRHGKGSRFFFTLPQQPKALAVSQKAGLVKNN